MLLPPEDLSEPDERELRSESISESISDSES
jgi:hypothetical protein